RYTNSRALGRAVAALGLFAISVGRPLSTAARRRQCRHGCAAEARHLAWPLPLHAQSDVSRTSDLFTRPRADILVLVRNGYPRLSCALVSSARAARRTTARSNFWCRIHRVS